VSLAHPLWLAALALIPLALVAQKAAARRRRRYAVRFPAMATLAAVVDRPPSWRRHVPAALLALAVAALTIALAKPRHMVSVAVQQASVMLVTDASGSMDATDVRPTRLAAAVSAAQAFLHRVPKGTKVGLVAFSTVPHTAQAPTTNRDLISATLESLSADGGTATGDALVAALQALGRNPDAPPPSAGKLPPAAIVLLSDGKAMGGRDPDQVARAAGRLHVPIYTVALGTPGGVVASPFGDLIPVPPDPASLRRIAHESGGQFFLARDADRLSTVYKRLGSSLGVRQRPREMTAGVAAVALALLALAGGLAVRWRGRLT
jgi:Ca-activated chloride channel family protein